MLKFFRIIRRKLLNQGSLQKYLAYSVGEILLIVIGILIALQINNWNQEKLVRLEEARAISGILADVQKDLEIFDYRIQQVKAKEESLVRVRTVLDNNGAPSEKLAFLNDIIIGADFGWNQGLAQRSTYEDLVNSGKLGIFRNPNIRLEIATYYRNYEDSHNRIDERETDYPNLTYRLVPRKVTNDANGIVMDREIESGLSQGQIGEIIEMVNKSPIRDHIAAEINLARFIHGITIDIQRQAWGLIKMLKAYQKEIQ